MGRPALPPRLYLAREKHRVATWVIRHDSRFIRTGAGEDQVEKAQECFNRYLINLDMPPNWQLPVANISPAREALIYFITCNVADFPVKIGIAVDVKRRLSALQNALPYPIVVLGTMAGTLEDERRLHIGFYRDRLNGEWFRRTPELLALIADQASHHMRNGPSKIKGP